MAVTFTPTLRHVYSIGDRKEAIYDIACTGVPTVGGDALTAAALSLDVIDIAEASGGASNVGGTAGAGVSIVFPATAFITTMTIVFYVAAAVPGAGVAHIAQTLTTAGYQFRLRVVGKGKAAGVAS